MTDKKIANSFRILAASNLSKGERQVDDFYATEPKAMELLLQEESFNKDVWECACGQGHLSKVLVEHGYNVKSTDLIYRNYGVGGIDFLLTTEHWRGCIITNPPYKYALEFIKHALDLIPEGEKVAMFLKLQFLEGKTRKEFFINNPPKTIYVSSGRLNCAKDGKFEEYPSSAVAFAWFVWEKGYKRSPQVKWIN